MNFGHGPIDRFLVSAPMALRPTLNEIETAKENLREEVTSDFGDVFANIKLAENEVVYTFDANGKQALCGSIERFVEEVNDAILSGRYPPKSKTPELVPRLATSLHVLSHTLEKVLEGGVPSDPPTNISAETLASATALAKYLESQKEIMCEFLKEITNSAC
ncbi:uncharacterized protein LOC5514186 isoform X1 [Nematostella vectensis]|uniref:uncharacterized protein LOC5514186 isoform X1 n=1 Tax=Nematostella vectensis TaxID=45351 RepID=UPI00207723B4|nr:uncharacterized protein LOC5514186 isoform X1 [Nematostella vectensis]